jgi:hypothetical protein
MKTIQWISLKLLLLVSVINSSGCYGFDTYTKVTYLNAKIFPPHKKSVETYFGAIKPENKFVQVALIEAVGERDTTTEQLLQQLQQQARALGADSVISIEKKYTSREQGNLFFDLFGLGVCIADTAATVSNPKKHKHHNHHVCDGPITATEYAAPVLTGVAVRYVDLDFPTKAMVAQKKKVDDLSKANSAESSGTLTAASSPINVMKAQYPHTSPL